MQLTDYRYVLERHIRQNEVLDTTQPCGYLAIKKPASNTKKKAAGVKPPASAPSEKIYRRRDVKLVRSARGWYQLGRVIKMGELPKKRVVRRKMPGQKKSLDLTDDLWGEPVSDQEEEDPLTGLYSVDQTELYVPPPVVGGIVPRNAYGNIDVYVSSMIPEGGVLLKYPHIAVAAKLVGVDYAPAVTGFDFGGSSGGNKSKPAKRSDRRGMATARIDGIVVAQEYEEAVRAVYEQVLEEQQDEDREMAVLQALKTWRRYLSALRIKARLERQHGKVEEEEEEPTGHEEEGGFVDDANDQAGGFLDEGGQEGGFVDEDNGQAGGFIDDGEQAGGFFDECEQAGGFIDDTKLSVQIEGDAPMDTTEGGFVASDDEAGGFLPEDEEEALPDSVDPTVEGLEGEAGEGGFIPSDGEQDTADTGPDNGADKEGGFVPSGDEVAQVPSPPVEDDEPPVKVSEQDIVVISDSDAEPPAAEPTPTSPNPLSKAPSPVRPSPQRKQYKPLSIPSNIELVVVPSLKGDDTLSDRLVIGSNTLASEGASEGVGTSTSHAVKRLARDAASPPPPAAGPSSSHQPAVPVKSQEQPPSPTRTPAAAPSVIEKSEPVQPKNSENGDEEEDQEEEDDFFPDSMSESELYQDYEDGQE